LAILYDVPKEMQHFRLFRRNLFIWCLPKRAMLSFFNALKARPMDILIYFIAKIINLAKDGD
jgi:hypothetical protein